ncbi:MAG: O-antigen ligase family protein [Solirubrobacteraceae bacterium]|nr:O-antigen ligase family protein [Solirubrobacteraceae bacterium]
MELRDPRPPALSGARAALGAAARVVLLAGPTALAFLKGGYYEDARLVAAIVAWALVAVLAVVADGPVLPRTAAARLAVGGLAALTLWALLSKGWAPLPGPAGDDVQRDVLYLGALVAGALAWRPRAWASSVEVALALGTLVVIGYGVLGRTLPGLIDLKPSTYAGGRLDQPLTYWNAMGALAAIGFVLWARIAGDELRARALRVAAAAAALPTGLALYLTYSRGALAAVACGLLVLALLAPTWRQVRSVVLVVLGAALVCAVAGRLDGVASVSGSLGHREAQGALMLAILVAAMMAVAAVQAWMCGGEQEGRLRVDAVPLTRGLRRLGWAAAVAVALLPFALAAVSERGEENPRFGASVERLASTGSNRYAYWRVALRTAADHPLGGVGAGGFRVEWLRERPFRESVRDAHSLYFETLAELGLVGFALLCALLAGVLLAVRRVLAADAALATGPAAALAVWAAHAGVDWDWELPALTLVAVALAGMLLAQAEAAARRA